MRNPAFSISLMTAPAFPALTVSGFKIVNVFCINVLNELFQTSLHRLTDLGGTLHDADSCGLHGGHLFVRSSLAAGNDGAGMAHSPARRRGLTADEADYGLLYICFDESRSFLFGRAADFSDHDNPAGLRIVVEQPDGIDKVSADDRVAADADAGRLADLPFCELTNSLVRQRSATRNHADIALEVNMAGHDSDFASAG